MSGPMGHGPSAAPRPPGRGFGGGGPFGGAGLPPEKARDFRGTFGRLVNTLRPEVGRILVVVAFAIVSVACAVVGPKLLGNATNILFDGVVVDPAAGVDFAALRDVLLVVATVQAVHGWDHLVVIGMLFVTLVGLMIAIAPNRRGS